MDAVDVKVNWMSRNGQKIQTLRNVRPTRYLGKSLVIKQR